MSFLKEFDHLKIQMKDIVSATDNFDPARVIGVGGFGKVYRGELSSPEGQIKLAFKHLDRRMGQGNVEFWKEIMMLSEYKHENLISLRHFCIEGDEMILAYEYAPRGSLDRYLSDANTLTWIQRLKICFGAARGIHFLHDPKETNLRVLHRDIKSANILLDENWTAKVSDFGLSKVGPANQGHSYLVSNAVGTPGYCDPLYWESGCLSKESDVYSFGVVLFEVLCGRLCFQYPNGELNILVPTWRQCYDEGRLDEIILPGLKEQMDPDSLESFSAIAYQCIMKAREERPTMAEIVQELENLLDPQVVKKTHLSSQKSTLEEIIKVIEDDNLQIVGLTGLGGVGKTTLASEVAATMNNQFSEIVFITVSQIVDSKMIQEKVHRAAKRIINREKVLVILDDVWEELKLDELGIPCRSDYMNCKILLTSRSTDVCKAMNAQKIIPVEPLKEGEAWTLFEHVVDKIVWHDKLKEVALKIVQECGGLPLFIQAVGKALKNKKMDRWEATLRHLQDPTDEDAPFKRDVIMRLKLSYEYLESEAAKAVFLMCSMFPKDGGIYINELTSYVMALGIFNNLLSIEDAKCRVQLVADSLQSSFLLQKMEEEEELYKMHDLVRDMALVITSKGNIKFMVQSGISLSEWQPRKDLESYNKISLMRNQICKLPDHELDFPHLDTFLIQGSFLELKNLKF